jgi:hypothetical protein
MSIMIQLCEDVALYIIIWAVTRKTKLTRDSTLALTPGKLPWPTARVLSLALRGRRRESNPHGTTQ